MKNIVVVSPHSDDETLGAGGYLLKRKAAGDNIYWINVTNVKCEYGYTIDEVKYWNNAIYKVKESFDFKDFFDLGLEPAGLDKINKSEIIQKIKQIFEKITPNIVLLPYYNDIHSDHKVVYDAVMACSKAFRCSSIEQILCMEIISETDYANSDVGFVPNYYVNISNYIEKKLEILRMYDSEISVPPFPRNIETIRSLARVRGAGCYSNYAEAFRLIQYIER